MDDDVFTKRTKNKPYKVQTRIVDYIAIRNSAAVIFKSEFLSKRRLGLLSNSRKISSR